jgi:YD repeat-containing protein
MQFLKRERQFLIVDPPMKYQPLRLYLRRHTQDRVPMTFQQVESVIGGQLPASARRHRPWWANDATGHAHAQAWLEAGYRTEQVDMEGEKLVFARAPESMEEKMGMAESSAPYKTQDVDVQHPMIGALKGLLWVDPTLDLTKPALDPDEWGRLLNEKYGKD